MFPFEMDGVTVVSESEIEVDGERYHAAVGEVPGVTCAGGNWFRDGKPQETLGYVAERWERDGVVISPSYGPAWEGKPYIPTPEYVREQAARLAVGEPLKHRYYHRSER